MSAVEVRRGSHTWWLNEGDEPLRRAAGLAVSRTDDLYIIFHSDGWFTYNGVTAVGKDGQTIKFACAGKLLATDLVIAAGKYGGKVHKVERIASEGNVDTYTITLDNGNTSDFTIVHECAGGTSGEDGVGISDIEKTSTSTDGLVDTYTITLTDESSYQFTVTNGKNGVDGKDGTNGKDGVDGKDGSDGSAGVGIANIAKTGWDGLVDTYTITLTDGSSYPFTVTNGDTVVVEPDGSFGVTDIVDQVLDRLPRAEGVGF